MGNEEGHTEASTTAQQALTGIHATMVDFSREMYSQETVHPEQDNEDSLQ